MNEAAIIARLDYLAQNNPIVRQCWQQMIADDLSNEQFLQLCVVALAEENREIKNRSIGLQEQMEQGGYKKCPGCNFRVSPPTRSLCDQCEEKRKRVCHAQS